YAVVVVGPAPAPLLAHGIVVVLLVVVVVVVVAAVAHQSLPSSPTKGYLD
ncbi:hypothetical protein A2U01_0114083, partial [Trifolium medium]|nr:hypothetical protein [Trifolium medium]